MSLAGGKKNTRQILPYIRSKNDIQRNIRRQRLVQLLRVPKQVVKFFFFVFRPIARKSFYEQRRRSSLRFSFRVREFFRIKIISLRSRYLVENIFSYFAGGVFFFITFMRLMCCVRLRVRKPHRCTDKLKYTKLLRFVFRFFYYYFFFLLLSTAHQIRRESVYDRRYSHNVPANPIREPRDRYREIFGRNSKYTCHTRYCFNANDHVFVSFPILLRDCWPARHKIHAPEMTPIAVARANTEKTLAYPAHSCGR